MSTSSKVNGLGLFVLALLTLAVTGCLTSENSQKNYNYAINVTTPEGIDVDSIEVRVTSNNAEILNEVYSVDDIENGRLVVSFSADEADQINVSYQIYSQDLVIASGEADFTSSNAQSQTLDDVQLDSAIREIFFPVKGIVITSPADSSLTDTSLVNLQGTAPASLDSVLVNGKPAQYDSVTGAWSAQHIVTDSGWNIISAIAFGPLNYRDTAYVQVNFQITINTEKFHTITGVVTNSANSEPVPGVFITQNVNSQTALTDADGIYNFTDMPQGLYSFSFSAQGFSDGNLSGITVTGEDDIFTVNMTLSPIAAGTLKALIISSDTQDPLSDVSLQISPGNIIVTSNADGRIEIPLSVGTYSLVAIAPFTSTVMSEIEISADQIKDIGSFAVTPANVAPTSITGSLTGDVNEIGSIIGVVTGENIPVDTPLVSELSFGKVSKVYTGTIYRPLTGNLWSLNINVYDNQNRFIGRQIVQFDSQVDSLTVAPFDFTNAKPEISGLQDVTLSMHDSLTLTGLLVDSISSLGDRADHGSINGGVWEWNINNSGFVASTAAETTLVMSTLLENFPVTARYTDEDSNQVEITAQVTVSSFPPTADISPDSQAVSFNKQVTLSAALSDDSNPGGFISKYEWKIDNGEWTTGAVEFIFTSPATSTTTLCSLRVTDDDGETAVASAKVSSFEGVPTVSLGLDREAGINDTITFTGEAEDNGTIEKYEWKIGDAAWQQTSSSDTTFVTSATPETITVTLRVTDNDGNTNTASVNLEVTANPPMVTLQGNLTVYVDQNISTSNANILDDEGVVLHEYKCSWNNDWVTIADKYQGMTAPREPQTGDCYYRVTDGDGQTGADTITVTVDNHAPVFEDAYMDIKDTGIIGKLYTDTLLVTDASLQPVQFNLIPGGYPSGMTITKDTVLEPSSLPAGSMRGVIEWTPQSKDSVLVSVEVADEWGAADTIQFPIVFRLGVSQIFAYELGLKTGKSTISGDYLYLAEKNGIQVHNISDPANTDLLKDMSIPSDMFDVSIEGSRAVVLPQNDAEFILLNTNNPANPVQINRFNLPAIPEEAVLSNGVAYMAGNTWSAGLMISDVSLGTNDFYYDTLLVEDNLSCTSVEVFQPVTNQDHLIMNCFESSGQDQLEVIDISGGSPIRISSTPINRVVYDLVVKDHLVYIVKDKLGESMLESWDFSTPSSPIRVDSISTSMIAGVDLEMVIEGDNIIIGDKSRNSVLVKATDGGLDEFLDLGLRQDAGEMHMSIKDGIIYTSGYNWLRVFEIQNP